MDDDRVVKEFERIQTIAKLEKEREIIASYRTGLARAWVRVGDARQKLGGLEEWLEDRK
jgi:hypothetical protein